MAGLRGKTSRPSKQSFSVSCFFSKSKEGQKPLSPCISFPFSQFQSHWSVKKLGGAEGKWGGVSVFWKLDQLENAFFCSYPRVTWYKRIWLRIWRAKLGRPSYHPAHEIEFLWGGMLLIEQNWNISFPLVCGVCCVDPSPLFTSYSGWKYRNATQSKLNQIKWLNMRRVIASNRNPGSMVDIKLSRAGVLMTQRLSSKRDQGHHVGKSMLLFTQK